jgi:threonine synthase
MLYYSTNDKSKKATFKQAFLEGQSSPDFGLFMMARQNIPKIDLEKIKQMRNKSYAEIAFEVLSLYLVPEIPEDELKEILDSAYLKEVEPLIQRVSEKIYIMWLTKGPTYSFKDYAARFFGRVLNYFLQKENQKKIVITATSGDTGGAVADALCGLKCIDNIVLFPKNFISERQRRQMTTLGENIYAFAVNGDFDVCQALAKRLLGDKDFAEEISGDKDCFTSANSISVGRLLPQAVYPFYAFSRTSKDNKPIIASIPSGNFGDMMGTTIAKEMGLPIGKIICGVNENTEFPEFLETGKYEVKPTKQSPSSAMMVSHPSNLARLIDFYGGHMYDKRDSETKQVIKAGAIDKMPDMEKMRKDVFSVGVTNEEHYETIKEVYEKHKIILDPHGAVGWKALGKFLESGYNDKLAAVYETADPAKFPEDVKKAIGITPEIPEGIKRQADLEERIYYVNSEADVAAGAKRLSEAQYEETKAILKDVFKKSK